MIDHNNSTNTNVDTHKNTKPQEKSNNLSKSEQSVSNHERLKRICQISGIPYHSDKKNNLTDSDPNRIESLPPQNSIEPEQNVVQIPQYWQKCFGGLKEDRACSIQQTLDGGYIVGGWTESNDGDVSGNHGGRDAWVMKLDSTGRLIWQRCLGGFSTDEAYSVCQTPDGGYIVAGKTRSTDGDVFGNRGLFDAWVVKLGSGGAIEWQRCIGGSKVDIAWCVQNTQDGGFVIAGETASSDGDITENLGRLDALVAKLDAHGEIEWHRIFGGSKDDHALFISPTSDGGYIFAGRTNSNDGDVSGNHGYYDAWIVKLDAHGEIEWQRCLGGSVEEIAYCIRQTADGGYIFAGRTNSNDGDVSGNHGSFDAWVVKLNAQGDIEWQRCLGGSGVDEAYSIQQTSDGGYIVAGRTSSNDGDVSGNHGGNDAWIVKLDAYGKITWQRCLGGSSYDSAKCIQQTSDGGFIACGFTRSSDGDVQSSHGGADAWIVKLDTDGIVEWGQSLDEKHHAVQSNNLSPSSIENGIQTNIDENKSVAHAQINMKDNNDLNESIFSPNIIIGEIEDPLIPPINFDDFIGQQQIIDNIKKFLDAEKKKEIYHILLLGCPGLGKRTLCQIISREMGVTIRFTSAKDLGNTNKLISQLTSLSAGDFLLIDDIHLLSPPVKKILFEALENTKTNEIVGAGAEGKNYMHSIKQFRLLGTAPRAELLEPTFLDRFGLICRLNLYDIDELFCILMRSSSILNISITEEACIEIAKWSRGIPRIANRLLRRVRDYAAIQDCEFIKESLVAEALREMDIEPPHCIFQDDSKFHLDERGIYYIGIYNPIWLDRRNYIPNPKFGDFEHYILNIKNNKSNEVNDLANSLHPHLNYGIAIAVVPSSKANDNDSGIRNVAKILAEKRRVDATDCLVRTETIQKLAHGGSRNELIHEKTISVSRTDIIRGKDILLLDDVTTSGNSLKVCKTKLLLEGANRVECLAIGKTART